MGFLKKMFGGGKKKKKDENGAAAIGNPSFPSATGSESRSGGRRAKGSNTGVSPSASLSTNGSNANTMYSNKSSNANAIANNNHTNAATNRFFGSGPQSMADYNSPRSSTGPVDTDDEGIIIPKTENIEAYYQQVRNQSQEELREAYERSRSLKGVDENANMNVDNLTANSIGDHDASVSSSSSPRLTTNQLKQWDQKSSGSGSESHHAPQLLHLHQQLSASPPEIGGISQSRSPSRQRQPLNDTQLQLQQQPQPQPQPQRVYTMSSALPSQQQMNALDDMHHSESDASSFNLSTDAEDSEYEHMRRTHVHYPLNNLNGLNGLNGLGAGLTALDTSAIDTVGSIASYTTDGEHSKIFANLHTDDDMTLGTLGTEASSIQQMPPSLLLQPLPNPLQFRQVTVPIPLSNSNNDTVETNSNSNSNHVETSGTTMSNSNHTSLNTSNDSSVLKNNNRQNMNMNTGDPSLPWTDFVADPVNVNQPTSTKSISRNKPGGTPRNFTTPKVSPSNDGFGHIRTSSSGNSKTNDSKNENYRNNKQKTNNGAAANTAGGPVDDTGFADFGKFADFSGCGFPSPANIDKGGAEWSTVKEEKKDQSPSWENQNMEFFKNNTSSPTKPKSHTSFGNDIDESAWNVSMSSPNGKKNISNERSREDPLPSNAAVAWPEDSSNTNTAPAVGGSNSSHVSGDPFSKYQSTSTSTSMQDTSLTELLDIAKSKRKDRRSYGSTRHVSKLSSSSVNSAPAITSSYLRQHHNLGGNSNKDTASNDMRYGVGTGLSQGNSYSNNSYINNNYGDNRSGSGDNDTSVSDIIHSLEETDRMKQRVEREQITSHRSMGDAGVVATARAAKERLRERRRRERETAGTRAIRQTGDQSDSDESDGHKNSESWLFDQVTGAMGPVGIAADLESLSGRSNRSKTSNGGKASSVAGGNSNRRRSSRNKSASHRRHRSDRSVDSRDSRASRYSHRSTKSFLSQMSEQSRSVANDLLRLEMQLAMVGNGNKDADGLPIASSASNRISSGASLGGGSRASARSGRKSSSSLHRHTQSGGASSLVVRRSKTTIVAPPGKLGIILANKADSKGTVVSGVRTSSVLVDRISPGDRIVAIDGEDVSRMTVSEITTIMSRKAEYERRLTVLTASGGRNANANSSFIGSPTKSRSSPRAASVGGGGGRDYGGEAGFSGTGSLSGYRR